MILHANAALSRRQRERLIALVVSGSTVTAAALVVGCSRQTGSKWVGRHRRGEGLEDRSSCPHRQPRRTPLTVEQAVLRARGELRLGPHPLGWALGLAASTVYAILRRHGCSRLVIRQREAIVYELRRGDEIVATGHLSAEEALSVGDPIMIGELQGIVRSVEPVLGERELRLLVQLRRQATDPES